MTEQSSPQQQAPVVVTPVVAAPIIATPVVATPVALVAPAKNSLGTAGMVCAIIAAGISFVPILNLFSFPLAILGLVFGAVGLKRSKTLPNSLGRGSAIAALVLSIIGLGLPILVLAGIMGGAGATVGGLAAGGYGYSRRRSVNPAAIILPLVALAGLGWWFWNRKKSGEPINVDSLKGTVRTAALSIANKTTPTYCTAGHPMSSGDQFCRTCGSPPAPTPTEVTEVLTVAPAVVEITDAEPSEVVAESVVVEELVCINNHQMRQGDQFCPQCGSKARNL